jgi:hypothetical protein
MPTDHDTVIADLKAEVRSFCEARDWDQFHGAKDLAIGIATERPSCSPCSASPRRRMWRRRSTRGAPRSRTSSPTS